MILFIILQNSALRVDWKLLARILLKTKGRSQPLLAGFKGWFFYVFLSNQALVHNIDLEITNGGWGITSTQGSTHRLSKMLTIIINNLRIVCCMLINYWPINEIINRRSCLLAWNQDRFFYVFLSNLLVQNDLKKKLSNNLLTTSTTMKNLSICD